MAEAMKLVYIVVLDNGRICEEAGKDMFRYTRPVLQSTLQLMGCKARHAFKISRRVFEVMKSDCSAKACDSAGVGMSHVDVLSGQSQKEMNDFVALNSAKAVGGQHSVIEKDGENGSRLGITTVISTDSIRHMMRSFADEQQNPLLWASTYHAGEHLDPMAVAEAKMKKKAKKLAVVSQILCKDDESDCSIVVNAQNQPPELGVVTSESISPKQMAIEGYKAQSEMVIDSLDRLITAWEERKESAVVEGVHLSLNFVMGLMKKHPSVIPFMIYISNEDKHLERFAVRAKYMTLDPAKNKYVKYIRNIRTIQEYLCKRADKHLVPRINNTNVDKSVNAVHATVFSCLRRRETGDKLYDPATNRVVVVDEEYRNLCVANSLSSKGMFQLIQRQGSARHLMALMNIDGSVAKAWPFESTDSNGNLKIGLPNGNGIGNPIYGPMQIGKTEPVNLPFGRLGISAWPSDTGGTSYASSFDESKGYMTENSSRNHSSCCSPPGMFDRPAKELKEDISVHASDEEGDDPPEVGSGDEFSDDSRQQVHEEMEGSVDEDSTKLDEEYDDLAMQEDFQENGCYPDNEELRHEIMPIVGKDKGRRNAGRVVRSKSDLRSSPSRVKQIKRGSSSGNVKLKKRSLSTPTLKKNLSADKGLFISEIP